jgi:hypothetical protein
MQVTTCATQLQEKTDLSRGLVTRGAHAVAGCQGERLEYVTEAGAWPSSLVCT